MPRFPSDLQNPWSGKRWEPEPGEEERHSLREELLIVKLEKNWNPQAAYNAIQQVIRGFIKDDLLQWERFELERAPAPTYFTAENYVKFCFIVLGHVPKPFRARKKK